MGGLLTVGQLLERRKAALKTLNDKQSDNASSSVHASMSDDDDHTVTVNTPPAPAILSVVSWNVQTFEAGKSLSSPFANVVISRILEDLAVDVCVLLETRGDSYVNMNAIETGHVGQGEWKAIAEQSDSDDDDDAEDDDEADSGDEDDDNAHDETGTKMEVSFSADQDADDAGTHPGDGTPGLDGGDPLRYLQLVSEMTGKRWVPPSKIYVYHPHWVARAKLVNEYAVFCDLWDKIAKMTNRPGDVRACLDQAVGATKKDAGKKAILKFVKDNKGAHTGKKRFTAKNAGAILKLHGAWLKQPDRFNTVTNASPQEKEFCASYLRNCRWLKSLATQDEQPADLWKQVLFMDEFDLIRKYYDPLLVKDDFSLSPMTDWNEVKTLPTNESWRFLLRIRQCPGCAKTLGVGTCGQVIHQGWTCKDMGPLSVSLGNLRGSIDNITFYRGCVQESYSLLVRQSTTITAPSQQGVWLNGKRVQMSWFQAGLLMYAPPPKDGTTPAKSGHLLGYQDKTTFYGRCPYRAPMDVWLYDAQQQGRLALVVFHGPYGNDDVEGVKARAASMDELMKADMGDGVSLADSEHALVMGDFNLDWQGDNAKGAKETVAKDLYARFEQGGFVPLVQAGTATSLKSIFGSAQTWKAAKSGNTEEFTSSAYDNMFLKGKTLYEHTVNAGVIDVIAWIEANIADFALGPEHKPPPGYDTLPARTKAFYIYRKYVSDHLPIIYDLVVQGMPDDSQAAKDAFKLLECVREQAKSQNRISIDLVMSYETLIDISPADGQAHGYDRKYEGEALRGWFVGDIYDHLDGQLVVRCEPLFKQVIWLSVQVMRNGKPAAGLMLKRFLELHPQGMRVRVEVLNPKPVG